jgi:hypothetical protein
VYVLDWWTSSLDGCDVTLSVTIPSVQERACKLVGNDRFNADRGNVFAETINVQKMNGISWGIFAKITLPQ